jgi:hypothetical protein
METVWSAAGISIETSAATFFGHLIIIYYGKLPGINNWWRYCRNYRGSSVVKKKLRIELWYYRAFRQALLSTGLDPGRCWHL